ncbi:MAG: S8 family peptidase [Anaerolineae bacterium]
MAQDKIAKALSRRMQDRAEAELPIIVKYARPLTPTRVPHSIAAASPSQTFQVFPGAALQATPPTIEALSQDPHVAKIWADERVRCCLDVSVPLTGVPRVWASGFTGRGVHIAVVDTGIDPYHPDFGGRIEEMADFTDEGVHDQDGHGTHVAGVAAGSGRASEGRYRGVAPEASLHVAKALDRLGEGFMSQVIAGLEWSLGEEVDVVNLSLGGDPPCDGNDPLSEACDILAERGVVVCVAAGNAGPGPASIGPPGCARQVLTVGASTDEDQIAEFSSRGPTQDGRFKPDLVFPGVAIVSCRADGTTLGQPVDRRYTQLSGTSMSAPHAAGVAALILEARPDLTPSDVRRVMTETTRDLGGVVYAQGAGRGDAFAALERQPATIAERRGCLPRLIFP